MARLLLLDIENDEISEVHCNELQDFYDCLNAEPFDITHLNIGGRVFDVFVDDMGLFRENPVASCIDIDFNIILVGNLIFANHDYEGNTTDLSDEDISIIKKHIVQFADGKAVVIERR